MVRTRACVSRPATRGDGAPRGVASACCGRREASGGGGEPSPHAVPSLMCDIGSHAWPCVRDWCARLHLAQSVGVYSERLRMLCVRFAQSVGVFSERLRLVCIWAQSAGVYSERVRMLTCKWRRALECTPSVCACYLRCARSTGVYVGRACALTFAPPSPFVLPLARVMGFGGPAVRSPPLPSRGTPLRASLRRARGDPRCRASVHFRCWRRASLPAISSATAPPRCPGRGAVVALRDCAWARASVSASCRAHARAARRQACAETWARARASVSALFGAHARVARGRAFAEARARVKASASVLRRARARVARRRACAAAWVRASASASSASRAAAWAAVRRACAEGPYALLLPLKTPTAASAAAGAFALALFALASAGSIACRALAHGLEEALPGRVNLLRAA